MLNSSASSITRDCYLPSRGNTATICGLNYVSRLFVVLADVLLRIRNDKRSPPQGQFAIARLHEFVELHSRALSICNHVPEPLKLNLANGGAQFAVSIDGAEFPQSTKDLSMATGASRESGSNPYLLMQAHIYVTLASFRLPR